jgi:tryptophan synthase alpha chain
MTMSRLEQAIIAKKKAKPLQLMTHIVLGYPSFEANREVIRQMVENGADLIELQIPFSEPMADGPVILKANQASIGGGATVEDCLTFAAEISAAHPIPFLFMSYFNIIFRFRVERFLERARLAGITGLIIPDLPPEEGDLFYKQAKEHDIAPIMIFAPTSSEERMRELATHGSGFIYCTARRGVTGKHSSLDSSFDEYLATCRAATRLPIAVGFGIQNQSDMVHLLGKADIAIIGSKMIKVVDEQGVNGAGPYIKSLLEPVS